MQLNLNKEDISKFEGEIPQIRSEIKAIQDGINKQILSTYEKEIIMQEIKSLEERKVNLERENSQISTEIHEGNRDLLVNLMNFLLFLFNLCLL